MIKLKKILFEKEINEFRVEGFDLDKFLNMNSFAEKVRYANEKLKRIAQGSSRIIFEIDDKTVLKLAKNAKGIAQNKVERSLSNDPMIPKNIIANVLEYDEKDRWIVMERAKKISKSRFKNLMGGVDILYFFYYLKDKILGKILALNWYIEPEIREKLDNNEFTQDLIEMVNNFDLEIGDFARPSSFGEIDGRLVITDYGLTKDVYKKYYEKMRFY